MEGKEEYATGESDLAVMLKMNSLSYAAPMDSSVINSRQILRLNFQNTTVGPVSAGSSNVDITVNSGDYYIYGPTSAISFDIAVSTGTGAFSAQAGDGLTAFNLIDTYTHLHRSGDQLDILSRAGPLAQMVLNYSESESIKQYQSLLGNNMVLSTTPQRVVLPLSVLSGLWGGGQSRALIPNALLAGSKIQLQFAPAASAIKWPGAAGTYTITNLALILDCYDLFDSAKRAVMTMMSNVKTSGIQYPFASFWNITQTTQSTALDFNFNYSAGRTISVLGKSRLTANLTVATADSMGSEPYSYTNYRWRLGSSFIPLDQVSSAAESYFYTQNAFKNYKLSDLDYRCPVACRIAYKDSDEAKNGYSDSSSNTVAIAADLQRNQVVGSYSGQPTNNSRLLSLNATFNSSDGRTVDLYLLHLKCANVMLDFINMLSAIGSCLIVLLSNQLRKTVETQLCAHA